MSDPSYITLLKNGELEKRVKKLNTLLNKCTVCPRSCSVNRNEDEKHYCRTGKKAIIASYADHHGEEPPLSGFHGSGTIFIGNCNLKCEFCQNYDISQQIPDTNQFEYSVTALARIMLLLQNNYKCHNINFVSPTHVSPQIVEALFIAANQGLNIPLVYNSNGYDNIETLKLLEGIFDIYLPDIKYARNQIALKYSDATDYVIIARAAIKEMYRQVGLLIKDKNGIARRGLIIRHLVLPENLSGTEETLKWVASELSPEVAISLLAQYHPAYNAHHYHVLARRISSDEYKTASKIMYDLGFTDQLYN